jgi:hypothetical protein
MKTGLDQEAESKNARPDYELMAEQAISCLWSFSESSDKAVGTFTFAELIVMIVEMIQNTGLLLSLRVAAAQFLNTLSEDNQKLIEIISNNMILVESLIGVTRDTDLELAILASAILYNISQIIPQQECLSVEQKTLSLLEIVLSSNIPELTSTVHTACSHLENSVVSQQTLEQKNLKDLELAKNPNTEIIAQATKQLVLIQLALELATNLYSEEVEGEQKEIMEDDDENDEMEEDEGFLQEMVEDTEEEASITTMTSSKLMDLIFNLSLLPFLEVDAEPAKIYALRLEQVRIRALCCINNIFLVGSPNVAASQQEQIRSFWNQMFEHVIHASTLQVVPLELVEALITAMWSISRSIPIV